MLHFGDNYMWLASYSHSFVPALKYRMTTLVVSLSPVPNIYYVFMDNNDEGWEESFQVVRAFFFVQLIFFVLWSYIYFQHDSRKKDIMVMFPFQ
jgi:hypothetical protein